MFKKIRLSKEAIVITIIVLLVMGLLVLALPYLTSEVFKQFIRNIHPFGPLAIIIYIALTQVLAPLPEGRALGAELEAGTQSPGEIIGEPDLG